jgi:hypothetical protein
MRNAEKETLEKIFKKQIQQEILTRQDINKDLPVFKLYSKQTGFYDQVIKKRRES